ncbi:MAG TPA: GMC oxidoreductase, partial [Jatrophihabitans sp.]|nr:GMC oxidoreductase [Jatrophihabitans sp.]
MWVWGNRADYDQWAAMGNPGWSADEVFGLLARAERFDDHSSSIRGHHGPIEVRSLDTPTPAARAFVRAAAEIGFDAPLHDYNGGRQDGFGFFYQTTRSAYNLRSSSADGYLRPALKRRNVELEVEAHVTRIVIEHGRAVAVEWTQHGYSYRTEVGCEVILSAGAFESPKLLMLSGIGPAAQLRSHGIDVLADLPGVGANLQDHLFAPVCFQSNVEPPAGALLSEAGLFTSTDADPYSRTPTLQFTFGGVKFAPQGTPDSDLAGPGITFAPIGLKPESRGRVQLRGNDPRVPAIVRGNYLSTDRDINVLVEGVRLAQELAHTSAMRGIVGKALTAGPMDNPNDLKQYVRVNATTLWHPVGTCRMGPDRQAVVDAALCVHGVTGLRVADASVMPDIVAANTNAASIMIGEKCAALVLESTALTSAQEVMTS